MTAADATPETDATPGTKTTRLYRRVADQLAAAIHDGTYKAGEKLPAERELAERFGVSRPTIREAMIALEIFNIVEIRHGSGIYVTEVPVSDSQGASGDDAARGDLDVGAFELIEARILIEGETAAVAAAAITDDDVMRLNGLIEQMRTGNQAACEAADEAFHQHLARITDNGPLIDAIQHLWDLRTQSPLAAQIMTRAQGGGRDARIAEHTAIVKALASRDPATARQSMRHHLEQVREYLLLATETAEMESLRRDFRAKRDVMSKRTGF